jgi:transcriptional regulator with XRE-family HTH domain
MNPSTPGDRVREARKRAGMTQNELAGATALTKSAITKIERDVLPLRFAAAQKIAVATGATTTTLMASQPGDAQDAGGAGMWAATSDVLLSAGTPGTPEGAGDALAEAVRLYHRNEYGTLSLLLPELLRDSSEAGPLLRSRVLQLAGSVMVQVRLHDAARAALDGSVASAEASGSDADAASAMVTRLWLPLAQGQFSEARELAARWADRAEPRMSRATVPELSVWGWLLLRGSAAAVRDGDPAEAAEFMRLAEGAAALAGPEVKDPRWYWVTFGPATVAMKKAENALVAGQPDRVLEIARQVPPGLSPTSDNRNRHRLDVAAALLELRQRDRAVAVLAQVNADGGPWLGEQRTARDLVERIVRPRRTLTPVMQQLAEAVRLPLG